MAWAEIYKDDFDNGVVDLSTYNTGVGKTITEAGTLLTIAVTAGTASEWWVSNFGNPVAYKTPLPSSVATRRKRYTAKIDSWTCADQIHGMIGLSLFLDAQNMYGIFYHQDAGGQPTIRLQYGIANAFANYGVMNRNVVLPSAPSAPLYLRIMWCPVHSRVTLYFAQKSTLPTDSDYKFFTSVTTSAFVPDRIGLFDKTWTANPASSYTVDWLQAEEEDTTCDCSVGWNTTYFDDFDDSVLSMETVNTSAGKTVTEAGSSLTLNVTAGTASDLWAGVYTAVIAYIDGLPTISPHQRFRYTAKITNYGGVSKATSEVGSGLMLDQNNLYYYGIANTNPWIDVVGILHGNSSGVAFGQGSFIADAQPNVIPLYSRIEWHPDTWELRFYYAQVAGVPTDADFKLWRTEGSCFNLTRLILLVKNWGAYPAASLTVDWVKAEEHDGTPVPRADATKFPSTTFPGLTLGKQWGTHRLENAGNYYQMLNPGIRLVANSAVTAGDYTEGYGAASPGRWWRGLRLLGAHCVDDSEWELDISRVNYEVGSRSIFGISLAIPQFANFGTGDYCGSPANRILLGNYRKSGTSDFYVGLWKRIGGGADFANLAESLCNSTSMTLKLKRRESNIFLAYYNIGAGDVYVGQYVDDHWAKRMLHIDIGYFMGYENALDHTFDVTGFRQLSGTQGVDYALETPTDTFSTGKMVTAKRYSHTGGYYIAGAQAISDDTSKCLELFSYNNGAGTAGIGSYWRRQPWKPDVNYLYPWSPFGVQMPWVIFPGDFSIDAELWMRHYPDAGGNCAGQFCLCLADACQVEWCSAQYKAGTGYQSDVGSRYVVGIRSDANGSTGTKYVVAAKPYNAGRTDINRGSAVDARETVRITRTGNIIRAYYYTGGAWVQIGTDWTDTVNWGTWLVPYFESQDSCPQGGSQSWIYYINWNSGDYDPREDSDLPYLQNQNPAPSAVDIPVDQDVSTDVVDDTTGIDALSVILTVEGVTAWQNDTQQGAFVVTKTVLANGFNYSIAHPDFAEYHTVTIGVYAEDNATVPNALTTSYSFRTEDATAPTLQDQNPAPSDVDVPLNQPVVVSAVDSLSGVSAMSVLISINGVTAWQNDTQQGAFVVTKTILANGFNYSIVHPDFVEYSVITIDVVAEDNSSNVLNTSYSFRTVDVGAPLITNQLPAPGSTNVALTATPSFDLTDLGVGINTSETKIWFNGTLIFDGGVSTPGWTITVTPITHGYHYLIGHTSSLPEYYYCSVRAYGEDLSASPKTVDSTYNFTTLKVVVDTEISDIFVVAKNVIMVTFSDNVVANSDLFYVGNYNLVNVSGGAPPVILSVLPTYSRVTNKVFFKLFNLVSGNLYRFEVLNEKIRTSAGHFLPASSFEWWMRHTKVDMGLSTIPSTFNKESGSTVRSLIEAIMMSDEKIGGDF
jgi:hypothetical protein